MVKHRSLLLLSSVVNVLAFSVKSFVIQCQSNSHNFSIMDEMIITIIHHGNLGFEQVTIFDSSSPDETSFGTLSVLPSSVHASLKLLSTSDGIGKRPFTPKYDEIKNKGIILVLTHNERWRNLNFVIRSMKCYDNCEIFILTKYPNACNNYHEYFEELDKIDVKAAYYICIQEADLVIYTLDWYGNDKNENWTRLNSSTTEDNFRATYYHIFKKDDMYEALKFIRIDKPTIYVGVIGVFSKEHYKLKTRLLLPRNNDTEYLFTDQDLNNVKVIERLINVKFLYYFMGKRGTRSFFNGIGETNDLIKGYINVVLREELMNTRMGQLIQSYPLHFEDYVIISKKQGPATPLEKIVKFYGHLTLISLVVLSGLILVVISFKNNFKFISATFHVLRLIINTAIPVSINTLSLRIFFSVIFLYFLILHATFSGNLAKFLTVDAYFDNIETIKDIEQSQINQVLILNHDLDNTFYSTSVYDKLKIVFNNEQCIMKSYNRTDTVCIGVRSFSQQFIRKHQLEREIYVSKKKVWTTPTNIMYHRRFYWVEKFNWALMFLTETKIYNWWVDREIEDRNRNVIKQQTNSHTEFRPINFNNLKFVFVFLIGGNSLGLVGFIIEFFIKRTTFKASTVTRTSVHPNINSWIH